MQSAPYERPLPWLVAAVHTGLIALFLISCSIELSSKRITSADESIRKAAAFLWSQQGEDGGWHSQTYGLLKSGQSLTPFVLDVLLRVPQNIYSMPAQKVDKAIEFILKHVDKGALGMSDPLIEDYPTYATALAIRAISRAAKPGWRETIAPMVRLLRRWQYAEEDGWKREDPAYGAWGFDEPRRYPYPGHIDLSMTRYVLQALDAAGLSANDPAFERARVFLARSQNSDGGFFFSTVEAGANKAGEDGDHYRSYGTATADGILALLATGLPASDSRVAAGAKWLSTYHRPDIVPGFPEDISQPWIKGMLAYYQAASSEALYKLGKGQGWRDELINSVATTQCHNGSWVHALSVMKEGDPLIATPFSLSALLDTIGF